MASLPKTVIAFANLIFVFAAGVPVNAATYHIDEPQISVASGPSEGGDFFFVASLQPNTTEMLSNGGFTLFGGFSDLIYNHAPFAAPDAFTRHANDDIKIQVSQLLANDFDADGGQLSIEVSAESLTGVPIEVIDSWIYYRHVSDAPDSFTYTVSDPFGVTSVGRVDILIGDSDAQFLTQLRIAFDAFGFHIYFNALPNRIYTIQSRDTLDTPWIDRASATDLGLGRFQFDDAAGTKTRFYRVVYSP